jgi:hypothetical protein
MKNISVDAVVEAALKLQRGSAARPVNNVVTAPSDTTSANP